MSGICALFNLDGAPVDATDLRRMAAPLERRGPDGTGLWSAGPAGLGHTLLVTTPELLAERQPLHHADSGCTIVADVRLDNRAELLAALGLAGLAGAVGDAGLILAAYLAWGEGCAARFLGDFAFALWDSRQRTLFCARDQFGMRPFYYHHSAERFVAIASEPRAILVLEQAPYRLNEGRIADFLITQLEGIDKTSTFFEEVYRLPPAHTLVATPQGVRVQRYWTLEPGEELHLTSDEAYAEAFLDVFSEAVRCRLRGAGPVGSMLSGGMDSGSVVAVARDLLAAAGQGPLPTFSAVGPDPATCVETRTIHAALAMEGLEPHLVNHAGLDAWLPALAELTWSLEEPFDNHMTLPRVVYLLAHRQGLKALLDGVGGDIVLAEGSHLARLLRAGRWLAAYGETAGQNRFWGEAYPVWRELYRSARTAFVPNAAWPLVRRLSGSWRLQQRVARNIRTSLISPDFARRMALGERLRALDGHGTVGLLPDYGMERARSVGHPYLTVGRERYDRVAAAVGMEPRDPFLDLRVVAFCLTLPGNQKLGGGWPKVILRRAMAGRLPDAVRWRRGKEHLGWTFTAALMEQMKVRMQVDIEAYSGIMAAYFDVDALGQVCRAYFDEGNPAHAEQVYEASHLAAWLVRHNERPKAAS